MLSYAPQDEQRLELWRAQDLYGCVLGGLVGDGTVPKSEVCHYNMQILGTSVVAGIPAAAFVWMLDRRNGFNRFLMDPCTGLLGQFIAARSDGA